MQTCLLSNTEPYLLQQERLPKTGKHIIGHFSSDTIVVYQAFNHQIAEYAVQNQKFGGNHYSLSRMTWIKPGFMWMMYRSGWAQKEDQECILAIHLKLDGFMEILRNAAHSSFQPDIYKTREDWQKELITHKVRLQWDPDHNPGGIKLERRAIQLGMKDDMLELFNNKWIIRIEDVTEFVKIQRNNALNDLNKLEVPVEDVFEIKDISIKNRLGIS